MTSVMTNLVADLTQQKLLYERLLKLAMRQRDFIAGDRVDELLELLEQRQDLIAQATAIEDRVRPVKNDWTNVCAQLDQPTREQVQHLLVDLRDLLGEVWRRDADDALVMQQKKLDVRKQIVVAQQQTQLTRNYAAGAYASSQSRINVQR